MTHLTIDINTLRDILQQHFRADCLTIESCEYNLAKMQNARRKYSDAGNFELLGGDMLNLNITVIYNNKFIPT